MNMWPCSKQHWCVMQGTLCKTRDAILIGLSKERPILGDHPKAHILEIWRISLEIWQISCGFQVKSSRLHVDFMKSGRFHMKSSGFHADFMKSGRFQVKSGRFHVNFMKSTYKTYKSNISRKTLQFYGVLWEGLFIWNPPDFERPIARNGKPYVCSPAENIPTEKINSKCCPL